MGDEAPALRGVTDALPCADLEDLKREVTDAQGRRARVVVGSSPPPDSLRRPGTASP